MAPMTTMLPWAGWDQNPGKTRLDVLYDIINVLQTEIYLHDVVLKSELDMVYYSDFDREMIAAVTYKERLEALAQSSVAQIWRVKAGQCPLQQMDYSSDNNQWNPKRMKYNHEGYSGSAYPYNQPSATANRKRKKNTQHCNKPMPVRYTNTQASIMNQSSRNAVVQQSSSIIKFIPAASRNNKAIDTTSVPAAAPVKIFPARASAALATASNNKATAAAKNKRKRKSKKKAYAANQPKRLMTQASAPKPLMALNITPSVLDLFDEYSKKKNVANPKAASTLVAVAKPANSVPKPTNTVAKATSVVTKGTGIVAKVRNSVAKATNSVAKATNTVAKATNTVATAPKPLNKTPSVMKTLPTNSTTLAKKASAANAVASVAKATGIVAKSTSSGAKVTNSGTKATAIVTKPTGIVTKSTGPVAKATNSVVKAPDSVAKTKSIVTKGNIVAKSTSSIVKTTGSGAKATNTVAKATGTVTKPLNSVARATGPVSKAPNSVAKATGTVAKATVKVATSPDFAAHTPDPIFKKKALDALLAVVKQEPFEKDTPRPFNLLSTIGKENNPNFADDHLNLYTCSLSPIQKISSLMSRVKLQFGATDRITIKSEYDSNLCIKSEPMDEDTMVDDLEDHI